MICISFFPMLWPILKKNIKKFLGGARGGRGGRERSNPHPHPPTPPHKKFIVKGKVLEIKKDQLSIVVKLFYSFTT
jgi:hypothetical protein